MNDATSAPTIFLKNGCPFCMKVKIFLLEADLGDTVELRTFAVGSPEESAIRDELTPHFEKPTFPTMKLADGSYVNESDLIIQKLASRSNVELDTLPTFQDYATVVLPQMGKLFQENMQLKKQIAG